MTKNIIGLPLDEALRTVDEEHPPRLVFADARNKNRDLNRLTPRVVRVKGNTWLVSHFKDGQPKEA